MDTTLFIRSYPKDFHWLEYSIKSIKKYVIGLDHKVLVVPMGTKVPSTISEFFDDVIESYLYEHLDGYIAQQFDKLDAYKYVDTKYILFSDSDTIYAEPFNILDKFQDGYPILYMTPYEDFNGGEGSCWKEITEKFLGFSVSHEFMRQLPILHRRETLAKLAYDKPNILRDTVGRDISEFNLIGAYAFQNKHPYYFTEQIPPSKCKQYWSWSGMTDEERKEIEQIVQ